jgi:hypothetical protein
MTNRAAAAPKVANTNPARLHLRLRLSFAQDDDVEIEG